MAFHPSFAYKTLTGGIEMKRVLVIGLLCLSVLTALGKGMFVSAAEAEPTHMANKSTTVVTTEDGAALAAADYSYSVKFVCGMQEKEDLERAIVRPGSYATEINIYNYSKVPVGGINVRKNVIPLVYDGEAVGREPKFMGITAVDGLTLPPQTATMDDCYRIGELLYGSPPPSPMPLTIGFLEVITPIDVRVDAVYTTNDLGGQGSDIEVEHIESRLK